MLSLLGTSRPVSRLTSGVGKMTIFGSYPAYPTTSIPENLRWLAGLNPMTWVVDFSRWALLGTSVSGSVVGLSIATTVVLLVSGLYYFRRVEHFFADVI